MQQGRRIKSRRSDDRTRSPNAWRALLREARIPDAVSDMINRFRLEWTTLKMRHVNVG